MPIFRNIIYFDVGKLKLETMDSLLLAVSDIIPDLKEDAHRVLQQLVGTRGKKVDLWPLVYKDIIVKHLVRRAAQYPWRDVARARTLWFRFISVSGTHRPCGCNRVQYCAVDMKPTPKHRSPPSTTWRQERNRLFREFVASFARTGGARPGATSAFR